MGGDTDFEDAVKVCEFYADPGVEFEVDLENHHITMGGYGVDLVVENGRLVSYLVEDAGGVSLFVDDLDSYFQKVLDWEERS